MIKWDPRCHMLSSSAEKDQALLIWTPKSKDPLLSLDQHEGYVREHVWANVDLTQGEIGTAQGEGIILTLSTD